VKKANLAIIARNELYMMDKVVKTYMETRNEKNTLKKRKTDVCQIRGRIKKTYHDPLPNFIEMEDREMAIPL
jgi:hypothetical protein